jgi:hypothetical protein
MIIGSHRERAFPIKSGSDWADKGSGRLSRRPFFVARLSARERGSTLARVDFDVDQYPIKISGQISDRRTSISKLKTTK